MAFSEARTTGGATICVDAIGAPEAPALVLLGGAGQSMDWWDPDLCARLAGGGLRVVRFDARDTGASTAYPAGAPGYTGADLRDDVVAVLDHLGVARAHVCGLSMGGAIAQTLALVHPDRVRALTLIATSPFDDRSELPGPEPRLAALFADPPPSPDWRDRAAVAEHLVDGQRLHSGPRVFDEAWTRRAARRAVARTSDMAASLTNHYAADGGPELAERLTDVSAPTLVIHGTVDPLFGLAHGRALAERIPGARLLALDGLGHEQPPPRLWDAFVDAVLAHDPEIASRDRVPARRRS